MSRRIVLPPDAFAEIPEGYLWSAEPDDADRDEHQFPPEPEFDDYLEAVYRDLRYEREERVAALLNAAEQVGGAL